VGQLTGSDKTYRTGRQPTAPTGRRGKTIFEREDMNIYECDEVMRAMEAQADINEGELTDEQVNELVLAQTTSIAKLTSLCNYMQYLTSQAEMAKAEASRVSRVKISAEKRVESIKKWLLPYLLEHGPVNAGTHRLSTRKSKGVVLVDGFNVDEYMNSKVVWTPDKQRIKTDIENGIEVRGAVLEERINVQFK